MSGYDPRIDEMYFLLSEVLHGPSELARLKPFAELDADLILQILEEAGKFVRGVIAPLSQTGDAVGARWHDGDVTMPPGFKEAYQAFWTAGWPALATQVEDGGQGLPSVLEALLYEMLSAANHGWTMAPGLLHGAYECIKHHASDQLKSEYLEKLATGQWLATMCLTEPQAGSDLGLCSTRANPTADGRYTLTGTKIFISGGEHDLTDNIVHLVLARLPDSPPGPKGLSLFLVPKFYPDGSRSAVQCERIEEKMGLHGSPTCVLRFEEAASWLVGEPGRGLNAMFVMMNAARLHVALQGIGLLDAAWQIADAYARERHQMRAPGKRTPSKNADPIAGHPAIGRILNTQRAWIDAGRTLAYKTAIELDRIRYGTPAAREFAQNWCALVTPVMKSAFTQQAFHGGSECLQVLGGHGYIREWGIEQIIRDARVTMIYEGTNEIQAIDLLVRKVLADGGKGLEGVLDFLAADRPAELPGRARATQRIDAMRDITRQIIHLAPANAELPYQIADDYLRAFALILLEWSWIRIGATVNADPARDLPRWREPATAFEQWVMPEFQMRLSIIEHQFGLVTT